MSKKTLALLCITCFTLQGCGAAVVAGAAAGGLILNDRRDVKSIWNDKKIQSKIHQELTKRSDLRRKSHIAIAVVNGTVLVAGQAADEETYYEILNIVQAVPHRRTYDQIEIMKPTSLKARSRDSMITTKAKATMLSKHGLDCSQIKVVTENRVIYLMGIVTPEQGEFAGNTASKIPGVKKVVKLFEYIN